MFPWPIVGFCVIFYAAKWWNLRIFPSQTISKFRNISLVDWRISNFYPAAEGQIQFLSRVWLKNFVIYTFDWVTNLAIFLDSIHLYPIGKFRDIFSATDRGILWFFPTSDWRISQLFSLTVGRISRFVSHDQEKETFSRRFLQDDSFSATGREGVAICFAPRLLFWSSLLVVAL